VNEDDTTQQDLIRDVEATARWRTRRQADADDPGREVRSADALTAAAVELAALPADDARLERLAQFYTEASDAAVLAFLGEQRRILSRHGYDEPATTGELLDALVAAADRCAAG
jgi:hypothetical protein